MRKIIVLSLIFLFSFSKVQAAGETDRFFTGQRIVDDLSVYHFGARFYSPTLGIFIQPDKVGGPNRYAYVSNNPVSFNDPSGKCGLPCILALLAVSGGMSTMPMASSAPPPDNPCAYGCMTPAQSELNLIFWRSLPPIGLPVDAYELKTGRSLASGRQLGKVDQFFNVVGVATGADFVLGKANSLAQAGRVSRYEGGLDLLRAKNPETVIDSMSDIYPDLKVESLPKDAPEKAYFEYPDSTDPDIPFTLAYQSDIPLSVFKHEGVHTLQVANKHSSFSYDVDPRRWYRFGTNFDAEMMAYGSTGPGGFTWQAFKSLMSSSMFVGLENNPLVKSGLFYNKYVVNEANMSWNYARAGMAAGRIGQTLNRPQSLGSGNKKNLFQ